MRSAAWIAIVLSACRPAFAEENASEVPPPSPELLAPPPHGTGQPSMHPAIVLRDANGIPVLASGKPASPSKTCDGCHDVAWIQAHDYHATANGPHPDRSMVAAGNCFLCHVARADNQARTQMLAANRMDEAATATLAGTGLADLSDGVWSWRKDRFASDGTVAAAALGLGRPSDRACGFCHGMVYEDSAPLSFEHGPGQLATELQGTIFSGQRISDSAVNLAGKDELTRPWDVHKERMVSCASCHFSPNHPAYAYVDRGPSHLQFDARRLAITEYLRRPDHRFARGPRGAGANRRDGNIRHCEDCHDASKAHEWLPRADRHFAALACETCHVPGVYAPARAVTDWTVLTAEHQPRVVYRGVEENDFVTGFAPVLLPRTSDGSGKLAPNNLVTAFHWVERAGGNSRPVAHAVLERALFSDGAYRPEVLAALDRDGDGKLHEGELVLDSAAKLKVVRDLLITAGASAPEIEGKVVAHPLNHGTSPGRFATRDCATCHSGKSRIGAPFVLASMSPFGASPIVDAALGKLEHDSTGRLLLVPKSANLHVFGHTRSGLLDGLGIILFAATFVGAGGHALLRARAARRRSREPS